MRIDVGKHHYLINGHVVYVQIKAHFESGNDGIKSSSSMSIIDFIK